MEKSQIKKITLDLIKTFEIAGNLSIELRKKGLNERIKTDNTPVTNGDIEVNDILCKKISELTPKVPIVSEESKDNKNYDGLKNFWLIDPIDGTRDYISNKDEFTLNAALILNKKPALGIINAPAKKRLFFSYGLGDSYEVSNGKTIKLIDIEKKNRHLTAVHYSDKLTPEILEIYKKFNITKHQKMKSSLKFCVVAANEFDLYVAEPRACEWDIAAGHAILEHAGGKLTDFYGNQIEYGKKDFRNPSLILKSKNIL